MIGALKVYACALGFVEIGFLLRWEADFLIFGAHAVFLSDLIVPARRFGRSGRQVLSGGIVCPEESLQAAVFVRKLLRLILRIPFLFQYLS